MKSAKIELTQPQRFSQFVFAAFSEWMPEVRNCFNRLREAARGQHDIARLNDHLLRDIGAEPRGQQTTPINRDWML